ncbi:hypothetical protein KY363_03600 [Candidatus Woesearchaeota archaeon]|nr:hypothetical protein [Candidatus Woesearchaeota archaeon]
MRLAMLAVVLVLSCSLVLVAGCGSSDGEGAVSAKHIPSYSGFMPLKAGMWTETISKSGSEQVKTRVELLEYSPTLAKYQFIVTEGDIEKVSQFWVNPSENSAVRYIVVSDAEIVCLDVGQFPSEIMPDSGSEYPASPGVSIGSYTTPAGKTVDVAKFSEGSDEAWVSSGVPFGLVKVVVGGKTVSALYDFGTIGASSRIAEADIDSCVDLSSNPDAEIESAELPETGVVAAEEERDEEADYRATAVRPGGSEGSISCSACDQMPPAARSACLAACS